MRTTIIVIAALISIGCIALAYYHNKSADEATDALNHERYSRMVAEEELLKASEKVKRLEDELASLQGRLEKNEQLLEQTMGINKELQTKLDSAQEKNASLQAQIDNLSKKAREQAAASTGEI